MLQTKHQLDVVPFLAVAMILDFIGYFLLFPL